MMQLQNALRRPWLWFTLGCSLLWGCTEQEAPSLTPHGIENPLILQRADPWVYQDESGHFFFTSSVPEFNRIELRQGDSLQALQSASPEIIWRKKTNGPMSANIWAPELHRIDKSWYLYFSAGSQERPFDIRLYALRNDADNPLQGTWQEAEQIKTRHDTFALDATTFEQAGTHYLVWSQKDPEDLQPASLHIARLSDPVTLEGPEVLIGRPEFTWEQQGIPANQGASVIKRGNRIFIFYTASATDHRSAIGVLWAEADADLLNPQSWHKLPEPVLATNETHGRLGPGHPSVIQHRPSGDTLIFYHSRDYKHLHGGELEDPNRHTRVRRVQWDEQGMPVLRSELPD